MVFTGSGLSATSGMSTFSTAGGLYERARRKHQLADGKNLFTYSFYDKHRLEAQSFFAEIHGEAVRARPSAGHRALRALSSAGRLLRHYTLNIDGLAERVGMDTWHPESNPGGSTVEMHGNVHSLVCATCGATASAAAAPVAHIRARRAVPCAACPPQGAPALRFKVMLYEDADSEVITPEEVMDVMEADAKGADLILWVGISFQQSASTVYFRKVRHWLQEAGRLGVVQAVVNPSDEALWNLLTASSNQRERACCGFFLFLFLVVVVVGSEGIGWGGWVGGKKQESSQPHRRNRVKWACLVHDRGREQADTSLSGPAPWRCR